MLKERPHFPQRRYVGSAAFAHSHEKVVNMRPVLHQDPAPSQWQPPVQPLTTHQQTSVLLSGVHMTRMREHMCINLTGWECVCDLRAKAAYNVFSPVQTLINGGGDTDVVYRMGEWRKAAFVCLSVMKEEGTRVCRAECYLQRCVPVTGTWHL